MIKVILVISRECSTLLSHWQGVHFLNIKSTKWFYWVHVLAMHNPCCCHSCRSSTQNAKDGQNKTVSNTRNKMQMSYKIVKPWLLGCYWIFPQWSIILNSTDKDLFPYFSIQWRLHKRDLENDWTQTKLTFRFRVECLADSTLHIRRTVLDTYYKVGLTMNWTAAPCNILEDCDSLTTNVFVITAAVPVIFFLNIV